MRDVRDRVKMQQQAKKRASHGSFHFKTIQEEVLDIIGTTILNSIVSDVKQSGMFVLISDETTLHNRQYLTLGLRYVHKETRKSHEESIMFREITSATAANIWANLKDMLNLAGLPLNLCIGAAFDGASTMVGHLNGVSALLKREVKDAVTVHCWSHKLSLAVLGRYLPGLKEL